MGRPAKVQYILSDEQKFEAIKLALQGTHIKDIAEGIFVDVMFFWKARQNDPSFDNAFAQARQEGLELLADDLMTIADDETKDVLRQRLKSDNYKWLLSKRNPKIYGDRIDLNVNQTVDIGAALKEAKERTAPRLNESEPTPILITDAQYKED